MGHQVANQCRASSYIRWRLNHHGGRTVRKANSTNPLPSGDHNQRWRSLALREVAQQLHSLRIEETGIEEDGVKVIPRTCFRYTTESVPCRTMRTALIDLVRSSLQDMPQDSTQLVVTAGNENAWQLCIGVLGDHAVRHNVKGVSSNLPVTFCKVRAKTRIIAMHVIPAPEQQGSKCLVPPAQKPISLVLPLRFFF